MNKSYMRCGTDEQAKNALRKILENKEGIYVRTDEAEIIPELMNSSRDFKKSNELTKNDYWYLVYYYLDPLI